MTTELKDGERLDDLQRNGYFIIQNPSLPCFGMDAVLLSDFVKVREGERVLDFCTGTGIIPILLRAKTPGRNFTGLEIFPEIADMAARSVRLNAVEDSVCIVTGDVREAVSVFGTASFDVVTCNPPYLKGSGGEADTVTPRAAARHEILCSFEDIAGEAAGVLKDGGRLYLVHRPFRLAEILTVLRGHDLEPKKLRLVFPYADSEANLFLLEAVRGAHTGLTVEKPLTVYEKPGVYTQEIRRIYGQENG